MAISVVTPGTTGLPVNNPLGSPQSGVNANGGVSVVEATGLSSDLLTTASTLFNAYNSDIEILNAFMQTDATGLAGGTHIKMLTTNTVGILDFWEETVANLGANATIDLYTASVVKQRTVVQQGKSITILSTVAACTGSGVWKVYIEYRPLGASGSLGA